MAIRIEHKRFVGGIEGSLSKLGTFFLVLGIIGSFFAFLLAVFSKEAVFLLLIFVFMFHSIVSLILLRGFAEVIRILKKLANIQYGGEISKSFAAGDVFICSECRAIVGEKDQRKWCHKCGSSFENLLTK